LEVACVAADRSDDLRGAFCNWPQGIPIHFTRPAAANDPSWRRLGLGGQPTGGETRPTCGEARIGRGRAAWLGPRFAGPSGVAGPDLVLGALTRLDSGATRHQRRQGCLRRRNLSWQSVVAVWWICEPTTRRSALQRGRNEESDRPQRLQLRTQPAAT